jgi:hypothetical protein
LPRVLADKLGRCLERSLVEARVPETGWGGRRKKIVITATVEGLADLAG